MSTISTTTVATTNSSTRPARRTLKGKLKFKLKNKILKIVHIFNLLLIFNAAFPAALKRLLTNKVLMLNNLSGIFFIFGISGYITFLPKYIETQFQQSAARSGLVNGTCLFFIINVMMHLIIFHFVPLFFLYRWHWNFIYVHWIVVWWLVDIALPSIGCKTGSLGCLHWTVMGWSTHLLCFHRLRFKTNSWTSNRIGKSWQRIVILYLYFIMSSLAMSYQNITSDSCF